MPSASATAAGTGTSTLRPLHAYHQVHRPYGLLCCPICRHGSMVVCSFGREGQARTYYAACEHEDCEGTCEGPRRSSIREAVLAFNEPLIAFSHSVITGHEGRPLVG